MIYLELALWPLLACLVIASLHTWLGIHVLKRGIIFIDIALAQVAALGGALGILWGLELGGMGSYALSALLTIAFALVFAWLRVEKTHKEAYIGITYAVTSALTLLVLDQTPEGAEHLKGFLMGNILTVSVSEVLVCALAYLAVGAVYLYLGKTMLALSDGAKASHLGLEFLFYFLFGVVVTFSVKIAGILLVFSFLIIPALCGALFFRTAKGMLLLGWGVSILASIAGLGLSFAADLPTGASIVAAFGALLLIIASGRAVLRKSRVDFL